MITKPLIIAEIGVNYYDIAKKNNISIMDAAKLMIDQAKLGGADVAKFQSYKSEYLAAENSPAYWDMNEEPTSSQRVLFSKYDKLGSRHYAQLSAYCDQVGIEFMSTPFDIESVSSLDPLVLRHKIASADVTNTPLLKEVAMTQKPVLLSTGASTVEEIKVAVGVLQENGAGFVTLLHCVLNYPTTDEDANLVRIACLKRDFPNLQIGYSDHTKFNSTLLITSWLLGAEVIEKHFTLDKSLKGNDHYHAADVADLKELNENIRSVTIMIGEEFPSYYNPKENNSRLNARRGVYLRRDVSKGESMKEEDVIMLRPQFAGLDPHTWLSQVEAKVKYPRDMKKGEQIK